MLQVVILAGGLATRLQPVTRKIPKSLVEVAGYPFIHHQLNYLKKQGINEVLICLGHMGEMVQEFVLKQSYGMSISFSFDGPLQLGTGGALKNALNFLRNKFFILYGDSFLPIDYLKILKESIHNDNFAIMTIMKNNNKFDRSNVRFISKNYIIYNKKSPEADMNYIDYGLSVISKKMIEEFQANNKFDLSDLLHEISKEKKLIGYEIFERFYEIGSHGGLADTRLYFEKLKP
jgi:MurNAc alpha-1-phosphate uridylyltransferase